jgi:CheY-like chemotaxis protein
MPGLDGFAVIDRLRAMAAPPPVIVVSGGAHPRERQPFGRPVVAVLAKPLYPADLVAACQRALSGLGKECTASGDDEE